MDAEYQCRAKIQEIEREISRIHLAAAAERANSQHRGHAAPKPKLRTASAIPLRLLRALRSAS